jgi:hypothetical protein
VGFFLTQDGTQDGEPEVALPARRLPVWSTYIGLEYVSPLPRLTATLPRVAPRLRGSGGHKEPRRAARVLSWQASFLAMIRRGPLLKLGFARTLRVADELELIVQSQARTDGDPVFDERAVKHQYFVACTVGRR